MKRFCSSDSLGALISISQPKDYDKHVNIDKEKEAEKNQSYSREFQAMLDNLDQEDCEEELIMEKKRRLNSDQVKALERNFEVENKLKPDRKIQLAEELGLHPRQVAIWFQNRRARWKTKQLERDYNVLKASYGSLKLNFDNLQQHNQSLHEKVRLLKAKTCRDSTESSQSVKEETPISWYESNALELGKDSDKDEEGFKMYEDFNFKDGSSSNGALKNAKYSLGLNGSSSSSSSNNLLMNRFQSQNQFVRMEEQSPFSTDESCNFFSVDQAPTLHCYFPLQ